MDYGKDRKMIYNEYEVPDLVVESLDRYVKHHIPVGSFLECVLCNDLIGACEHADFINRRKLFEIALYVYNEVPSRARGSYDRYKRWLAMRENNNE